MLDAKTFGHELRRMCKYYEGVCYLGDEDGETVCPLNNRNCTSIRSMGDEEFDIVENWSKANPPKTRQDEFLDRYPNAVGKDSVLYIYPCMIDDTRKDLCISVNENCFECRKKYWGEVVE